MFGGEGGGLFGLFKGKKEPEEAERPLVPFLFRMNIALVPLIPQPQPYYPPQQQQQRNSTIISHI
jgi:hypothetical protein